SGDLLYLLVGKSDPENHHKLAPLGSIGELLVEGPILARGYLNDADKTAATFIDDPAWLLEGCGGNVGRRGRLYKTGDLVRYDSDGNLICLGRKGDQVKVHGQRVELGEVEHHVRECVPEAKQLAVEVIVPEGEGGHPMLAAFIQLNGNARDALLVDRDARADSMVRVVFLGEVEEELAERLPGHMVPAMFFTIQAMPTTTSGKTDRKRLREIGASFTAQQLAEMRTLSQDPKRQPATEAEQTMQQLWAHVLDIEQGSIGLDDSFFRLGGDSITAMKLVAEARKQSVHLTVASIFQHPRLCDSALKLQTSEIESDAISTSLNALLNHRITRREYDSPLVCALAVLGVKEDGWKGPEQYPPILSAVIKIARFMVVQKGLEMSGPDEDSGDETDDDLDDSAYESGPSQRRRPKG
ncbi:EntF Non-ribosomal peptide synthetase module protein, partial [Pyrenophora tritici-repentis]